MLTFFLVGLALNFLVPRLFTYGFAAPLMGFITGTFCVSFGGLINLVPFTLEWWAILNIVGTVLWCWAFYSARN